MLKKIVIGVSIILVILVAIVVGGAFFMMDVALKTKVEPNDKEESYKFVTRNPDVKVWIDSLNAVNALRDTIITSFDGKELHALYVKSAKDSANTALVIHGYTDSSIRMLMIGQIYAEMDYNILLPDLRGQGMTKNEWIQMGWNDRLDILQWIDVCLNTFGGDTEMVLHGISMGAATTMMTSGEDLPPNVKCFVEDCGFTSVWDEYQHELKKRYGLPTFPLLSATSALTDYRLGWNFKEASAYDQIQKTDLPMFFIHGGDDDYVPTSMVYQLYDVKTGDKDIWVEEGVGHANMYWDHTDQYKKKTKAFVEKYIN